MKEKIIDGLSGVKFWWYENEKDNWILCSHCGKRDKHLLNMDPSDSEYAHSILCQECVNMYFNELSNV